MDSDDMKFRIVYDGPALENHEMDIRDLAPALIALSDVFEEAAKTIYGKKATVTVKVNASFKAGSFGIDLLASSPSWIKQAIEFLSGDPVSATLNLITLLGLSKVAGTQTTRGLLDLIKWIGPRKVKSIHKLPNRNVKIFIDDEEEVFEEDVVELYKNYKLRESLQEVIARPLEKEGIDSFAATLDEGKTFVTVSKREAEFFYIERPVDSILSENTTEKALQVINVSFSEGNKWRFSDGSASFLAEITDEHFLQDVNSMKLNFSKGDMLLADLKVTQYMSGDAIKTSYEVTKVKKQINPQRQIEFPFE
ncbi:TPA: hypothetical protein ACJCXE_004362 [Yersinia enterocolitica]|uniref:Uncharacterized protein n=1 Tax=Yersinia pekkanenii TaxID=1288385 RepID=A0A0T9RHM6_9GAMM|nr:MULTISPECIES: hypothetical protein [Yersinia]MDN0105241.1 hypothetical protein [Yersinia bercovieri]CFB71428.1 Uncharacterised protein [Yersinia enterocolitica]CNI63256.1 Uncharacterised protein [Yersinia pekkanenii]CRY69547.1 Uncharacterised protein [Yersinia pekkanenii]HDL6480530.1 hypothetical protein [Yersinia enterocolitica]